MEDKKTKITINGVLFVVCFLTGTLMMLLTMGKWDARQYFIGLFLTLLGLMFGIISLVEYFKNKRKSRNQDLRYSGYNSSLAEIQRICESCGRSGEISRNYCRHCGAKAYF